MTEDPYEYTIFLPEDQMRQKIEITFSVMRKKLGLQNAGDN